jgi:hypothetical protein
MRSHCRCLWVIVMFSDYSVFLVRRFFCSLFQDHITSDHERGALVSSGCRHVVVTSAPSHSQTATVRCTNEQLWYASEKKACLNYSKHHVIPVNVILFACRVTHRSYIYKTPRKDSAHFVFNVRSGPISLVSPVQRAERRVTRYVAQL